MLPATLRDAYEASLPGTPQIWKIPAKDVLSIEDCVFIKLCTRNSSLSSLLGNVGGHLCLTRSDGYKALLKLRNLEAERQVEALEQETQCTLFDDVKKVKKRVSRSDAARERANRDKIVEVDLSMDGKDEVVVTMLRPVHPSDHIYIKYDHNNVSAVLHWLGHHSFSSQKRPRNPDKLPRGISRHANGFSVIYTAEDGSLKRKLKNDLESALAFHADPIQDDADDEASQQLDVASEGGA